LGNQESKNIKKIDDELKTLKEKRQKLKEISSQIKNIHEKKIELEVHKQDTKKILKNEKKSTQTEKLALSKQEILDFCDEVLKKWSNDPSKDSRYTFAMNAVKTSILWTEEDTIKEIWSEIIHWAFALLYKNAIAQGNNENLEWSKIMEQLQKTGL